MPPYARASPAIPATRPSIKLSVSSWATIRPWVAPSAARIAISRRRAAARASCRFAELAQAIGGTTPGPTPSNASTARRNWDPMIISVTDSALTDQVPLVAGYSCASRAAICSIWPSAAWRVTPGASRASSRRYRLP